MVNSFHTGDFVRRILERRHINVASVAEAMGIARTTFGGYLDAKTISDTVLIKITNVIGFDLYGMVKAELQRLATPAVPGSPSVVAEDMAPYGRPRVQPSEGIGVVWQIHADDFDEDTQMSILRFLNQQPRRARTSQRTGS